MKVAYSPTLFLPAKKKTDWTNLYGEYLEPMKFESMRESRDFVKRYNGVENFTIYGNTRYEYAFIAENHSEETIDWNIDEICIGNLDIEVGSENGFPEPKYANEPLTAITLHLSSTNIYHVFACGDYKEHRDDVVYIKCEDEFKLIKAFLRLWREQYPDVLTGWNVKGFDIPYLVNRISKLFGEEIAKELSPWGVVNQREETFYGKSIPTFDLYGICVLDYLQLFRKYAPNYSQESYRLDHIAQVEGVGQKIAYDDYDNLFDLYKKNHQKFIEYNIRDVELVFKLNAKGKLIDMALTLAYDNKVNFDDVFAQVTMWDAITYNHLLKKKIAIPPKKDSEKDSAYEGAYVKDPQIGMFNWLASFDLNSLYPHLIMQYNISPDTLIEPDEYTPEMKNLIAQRISVNKLLACEIDTSGLTNATMTPNGQFFRTDKQGFLPEIMEKMYNDRVKYKTKMLEAQQNYENAKDAEEKKHYSNIISRYKNLQLAKKVGLNSAYGALGNQYFRFFDTRQAEGITLAGQLSIRWIENKINEYMNTLLKTEKDYVVASDTDSIYLNLGPLVDSVYGNGKEKSVSANIDKQKVIDFMDRVCEDKIQPFIDKSYQELAEYVHAYSQKMQMKREVLADKAIWTAKKRYILNVYNSEGVQYAEPKLKISGIEAIKSSTPSACREKIKEALKIIISGNESEMQDYIENFRQEFKSLPPEDISFPRSINGLKEYGDNKTIYKKGTPIHVRGALIHNYTIDQNKLGKSVQKIQEGEKIKFIYLKEPNSLQTDVISFLNRWPKEFDIDKYIDYNLQFEKSFIDPLKIILDCINWKAEKINSLDSFFG